MGRHSSKRVAEQVFAPEFALAVACCRWPPSEDRNAAIRAAAASVRDWNSFLRLVTRHRMVRLVHEALRAAGIELQPTAAGELAARVQRSVRRNLFLGVETVRLQGVFETAGIPLIVLKGTALAQLAYGSSTMKQTRDVDLLVPPDQAEVALQILEREGYLLQAPAQHLRQSQRHTLVRFGREVELRHRRNKVQVELQWHATDNPLLLRGVDAHSPAQSVALPGGNVRTLAMDDLFAYLCVHGARHAWSRLKWLADVNALLKADDVDIGSLYRHAEHIGAGLCAGQTLLLCQRLFALRLPGGPCGRDFIGSARGEIGDDRLGRHGRATYRRRSRRRPRRVDTLRLRSIPAGAGMGILCGAMPGSFDRAGGRHPLPLAAFSTISLSAVAAAAVALAPRNRGAQA